MVVSHGYFLLNLTERSEIDTALRGITNHAAAKEAWDGYLAAAETTHFLECEMYVCFVAHTDTNHQRVL